MRRQLRGWNSFWVGRGSLYNLAFFFSDTGISVEGITNQDQRQLALFKLITHEAPTRILT